MIEPTDEMIYAFAGESEITATDAHAIRVGLAAVLAIVERDHLLTKLCGEELGSILRCTRPVYGEPHRGDHEGKTPTGSKVTWS